MHRRALLVSALLLTLVVVASTGCRPRPTDNRPAVATSTAYLASAVRDLLGDGLRIVTLAGPGMCPGHFDIRPSSIQQLRDCRLVLRFDFQGALDRQFRAGDRPELPIIPIALPGGMCTPATYLAACRQVADALVAADLAERAAADEKLADMEKRLAALADWARQQVADAQLAGAPVVTSGHQADFCQFLGLDVVALFSAPDRARMSEVNQAIRDGQSAGLVIANLPEGTDMADALADRLGARMVVFGNFPDEASHGGRFDELVRDNVRRLVEASAP